MSATSLRLPGDRKVRKSKAGLFAAGSTVGLKVRCPSHLYHSFHDEQSMKSLAISWNASLVRFVLGESTKGNALRVLQSGERLLFSDAAGSNSAPVVDENPSAEGTETNESSGPDGESTDALKTGNLPDALVVTVQSIIREHKASKARLLICVNRGLVEAASFPVPPADVRELPVIVNNMASRYLSGLSKDSVVDFVPQCDADDRIVRVTAMALPKAEQELVQRLAKESGCASARAIVVTHPLRLFASPGDGAASSVSLVVSKGRQSGQLLLMRGGSPFLSRSLRLPRGVRGEREAVHLAAEVQKTLFAVESESGEDLHITDAVVIGAEIECSPLQAELSRQLGMEVRRVSATSVVEGEVGDAAVSAYAPLIAACAEDALKVAPAVDFLNPRQPPKTFSRTQQALAIAAALLLLLGGGWYYVNSMFAEARAENARLRVRSRELDELVKDTRSKRNLAKVLAAWENNRISWLDELRDLTIRTPSSPDLTIDQFSAAASGSDFIVSFRGTSKRPEVIRAMEEQLRDKYHSPKTPGIREVQVGRESQWVFQTTMGVKHRPKNSYTSHLADEQESPAPPPKKSAGKMSGRTDNVTATAASKERP
ncbi:MAG: hypothetical protein R3C20_21130 [Planctomycetaceae bacterium]